MGPIRFSIIDYLNALPLNLAFKDRLFQGDAELLFDFPSQCADNLAANRADVGLISSIEYQRIPNLVIAPKICIASRREVRSVLILTKKDMGDIQTVALDRFSRSSVALLQILFHRKYGGKPRFLTMAPSAGDMLAAADAALIIGDAALQLEPGDYHTIDLAAEWHDLTGLPFVFAFWAIRNDCPITDVVRLLLEAKDYGLERVFQRIPAIQARWQLEADDIRDYFTHHIHFDLGEKEEESLNLFYRFAAEAGLIDEVVPPRFAALPG